MKSIFKSALGLGAVFCAFGFSSSASAGSYSLKCDDFLAAGFGSKDLCLKDGRYHLVYEINAQSSVVYGSVDGVQAHMLGGADFKIVGQNQNLYSNGSKLSIIFNVNEKCQQVYRSQSGARPVYCLTSQRFSGEQTNETGHGSARYGTDGRIYCNVSASPGGNGCSVDPVALQWFVKY